MLEEIARLLGRTGGSGSFATRRTCSPEDLCLEVRGVGRIRFPVGPTTARKLCDVARPARHGYKEETRLDRRVRDTWEIPKSRLSIDERRWARTLAPQLDRIRRDLGLADGCRLKAQLHNLLVYAPGQFFAAHQDSEKADGMIGTLVVSLPSRFTGGAMAIEHHDERMSVGGSDRHLTFVAFYADCRHEVRPVKYGYRIVLTYNLIAGGDTTAISTPPEAVAALSASIRRHFETPSPSRWASGDRDQSPPDRLVYLLDHQYTPRALAWNRLKNADAARAAVLREVAGQLGCEISLALADVHETWSCEDEYDDYGRYDRRWNNDDDDGEEESDDPYRAAGEPELTELIDSEVELRPGVGSSGTLRSIGAGVGDHELCFTKPSRELEPFESEHEGYTGNAGNTVDRWYHRAAVVLWPRERSFVIRAKASPRWAMARIAKSLEAGHADEASALARQLLPFWADCIRFPDEAGLLERALKVAAMLPDAQTATALLLPFALLDVTPKIAPRMAMLLDRYGLEWCRSLLRQWTSEKKAYEPPESRLRWMSSALLPLCRALCARKSPDGHLLAGEILAQQWAWLLRHLKRVFHEDTSDAARAKELSGLGRPTLAVVESSRIANLAELHEEAIDLLTDETVGHSTHLRLAVLRAAHARHRPDALRALGLKRVHVRTTKDLSARLGAPPRSHDDWSITMPLRCSCKLCATLTRFLRAPDKMRFEWPLAKAQRAHIHQTIDFRDLPVSHTTRRTGRPFTLVLEKTTVLFQREAAARRTWQAELDWLTRTAADF